MISQTAKIQDGVTKVEKFTIPQSDGKNYVIYVATYGDKFVVLSNSTQLGNISNIEHDRYIGITSKNPNIAAIYYEKIGTIESGILFSNLNSKQIRNKAITEYCTQLENKMTAEAINRLINNYKKVLILLKQQEKILKLKQLECSPNLHLMVYPNKKKIRLFQK